MTALMIAIENKAEAVVKLLIEAGADLEACSNGVGALQSAVSEGAGARLKVGDLVTVTSSYKDFGDAGNGPIDPGGECKEGRVIEDDGSDVPFQVKAGEKTWWYRAGALKKADGSENLRRKVGDLVGMTGVWWLLAAAWPRPPPSRVQPCSQPCAHICIHRSGLQSDPVSLVPITCAGWKDGADACR